VRKRGLKRKREVERVKSKQIEALRSEQAVLNEISHITRDENGKWLIGLLQQNNGIIYEPASCYIQRHGTIKLQKYIRGHLEHEEFAYITIKEKHESQSKTRRKKKKRRRTI